MLQLNLIAVVLIVRQREVLKRGLDWEHEEDAIQRLKSMLWALEALRILDDRLSDSLNEVSEAKVKMLKHLNQVTIPHSFYFLFNCF